MEPGTAASVFVVVVVVVAVAVVEGVNVVVVVGMERGVGRGGSLARAPSMLPATADGNAVMPAPWASEAAKVHACSGCGSLGKSERGLGRRERGPAALETEEERCSRWEIGWWCVSKEVEVLGTKVK